MFKKLKLEFGYCLYTDSIQSKSFCEDCSENLYQYTKKECSLKERIKWYKECSLAVKDKEIALRTGLKNIHISIKKKRRDLPSLIFYLYLIETISI